MKEPISIIISVNSPQRLTIEKISELRTLLSPLMIDALEKHDPTLTCSIMEFCHYKDSVRAMLSKRREQLEVSYKEKRMKKAHDIALLGITFNFCLDVLLYMTGIVSLGVFVQIVPFWMGYYAYHFLAAGD